MNKFLDCAAWKAISYQEKLCLALVDQDHFGLVNKQFGWPTSDKALTEVCDVIQQHLRAADWVGHYGDEKICLVLPNTNLETAG